MYKFLACESDFGWTRHNNKKAEKNALALTEFIISGRMRLRNAKHKTTDDIVRWSAGTYQQQQYASSCAISLAALRIFRHSSPSVFIPENNIPYLAIIELRWVICEVSNESSTRLHLSGDWLPLITPLVRRNGHSEVGKVSREGFFIRRHWRQW